MVAIKEPGMIRRYFLELGLWFAAYALVLAGSLWLLQAGVEGTGLRIAVSLSPMVPGVGVCWAVLRQLGRMDEMQRRLQLEALAIAFAGTALVTFSYGFLENAGFPKLSMFAVWPLMAALWLAGTVVGALRYR